MEHHSTCHLCHTIIHVIYVTPQYMPSMSHIVCVIYITPKSMTDITPQYMLPMSHHIMCHTGVYIIYVTLQYMSPISHQSACHLCQTAVNVVYVILQHMSSISHCSTCYSCHTAALHSTTARYVSRRLTELKTADSTTNNGNSHQRPASRGRTVRRQYG